MIVLGIDTSCDDTSVAVVKDTTTVLANVISSQGIHLDYGGVVPELASRAHLTLLLPALESALQTAQCNLSDMDAIAVTRGPGLIGSLLIGLSMAKSMCLATGVPLVGVNHMEGHIFAGRLSEPTLAPPFLALIVSGGHTQLMHIKDWGIYDLIGKTRDDAAGEAFDKVAKMMNIGFPGGPAIDRAAKSGDARFVDFPRSFLDRNETEFSFSGVKTAVRTFLMGRTEEENNRDAAHIAASFQEAVVDVLVKKSIRAANALQLKHILITGGVACNSRLRALMTEEAGEAGISVSYPAPVLCTDNGAMIASAGSFHYSQGNISSMSLAPDPRAPLVTA